ncbi:MAG: hypothetical protein EDX89_02970 [Acidobacteria bacterium]|nr:MAG: hypothetical protein EDX89_02970 [Acidobacteriota bacterium]
MRRSPAVLTGLLALAVLLLPASPARAIEVPSPSGFLGMAVGADRTLADWEQVSAYFRALDAASPRVEVVSLGKTTLGAELLMAVVSSEENLARKDRIREVARRLADPRGLTAAEEAALVEEGRAVVLVTCAIHSSEVAATQMAMEWAHALATGEDEETRRRLSEVVLLLVPSLNPDGHRMEVEWYRKNLGTPYEGSRMPWLYHPYVGHDDNRDWTMLTQVETKAMTRAVYKEWHPQVWLDEHQMGSSGPRMFVPPYAEPVDPDIHPLVWREVNLIGSRMALALEQAGKSGVIYGYSFDAYWIGGTKNTAWWKNVTGLLTEVASARMATPVFVPETELSGGRKGLVDYGPQTNFPNPWPGGWWRLRDVMDYERIASDALLATCADHRRDLLFDTAARARQTVAAAAPGEAIRIPAAQRDRPTALLLARLLDEHGVEVRQGPGGDLFVPLGQPYGRFVREVLGTQRYPEVRLVPGKEPVLPYDVAAWSLPLLLGVAVEPGKMPDGLLRFEPAPAKAAPLAAAGLFTVGGESPQAVRVVNVAIGAGGKVHRLAEAAGTWFLDAKGAKAAAPTAAELGVGIEPAAGTLPERARPVARPRVGLYKPWVASMDEGWTRFLLERYGFAPVTLDNGAVKAGKLRERFDAIVLPDVDKDVLATGKPKREDGEPRYWPDPPPEYRGGIEKEGAAALKAFVEAGGTLVALGSSTAWVTGELNLPVRNALAKVKREEFLSPGSLLKAKVLPGHPVTLGLPEEAALFVEEPIAFETQLPGAELERWVLAWYPREADTILLSGFLHGADRIARKAAAVATTYGKGKVVLLGFKAQQRAQSHGTFPFLFNALYWSAAEGR